MPFSRIYHSGRKSNTFWGFFSIFGWRCGDEGEEVGVRRFLRFSDFQTPTRGDLTAAGGNGGFCDLFGFGTSTRDHTVALLNGRGGVN